jgi:hypothetical protein
VSSSWGLSGSEFLSSDDHKRIIKSIGRRFERRFLLHDFLPAYYNYVDEYPDSMICQVTDVLKNSQLCLGIIFGLVPRAYMVMKNLLEGLPQGEQEQEEAGVKVLDLKPMDFFEPTRDLVPDGMKTTVMQSGLADELDEAIVLSRAEREWLL